MRVRLLGTVLLGTVLLSTMALAACDSPEPGTVGAPSPSGASVDGVAAPLRASTAAPPGRSVAPVTDCGTFVLSQGENPPDGVVDCLLDAVRARRPARLAITSPTVEGDPMPVTYASDSTGRVEIVTDSRQDRFGAKEVVRQVCTTATSRRGWFQFSDCSPGTTVGNGRTVTRSSSS